MLHTIRTSLHQFRSRLVTARYQLFGEQERDLNVSGISARFKISSHAERWRVEECMGEREVVERFLADIDDSTEVWDIGAAVGTYSILAAKRADHVTAFEPEPNNHRRLQENVELNDLDNIDVRNIALSDTNSELQMDVADGAVGGGAHRINSRGNVSVSARRGKDLNDPSPDLVKIDVEGHEMKVIKGMGDKLSDCSIIYVEAHPDNGVAVESLHESLRSRGFETTEIERRNRSETYIRGEA